MKQGIFNYNKPNISWETKMKCYEMGGGKMSHIYQDNLKLYIANKTEEKQIRFIMKYQRKHYKAKWTKFIKKNQNQGKTTKTLWKTKMT